MAGRAVAVNRTPGITAAAFVAAVIFGTLLAVALRAEAGAGLGAADWAAIRFTLWQAFLSASLSCLLAVPVARALSRRKFPLRGALVILLGAPFILPVIVAVLGLIAVFGRSGVLNATLGYLGLPEVQIYGLHGVVLAHVFFNLPLATRLVLLGWQSIPAERFRLAAQLDVSSRGMFLLLEAPMLARTLPGAWAIIFAICLSSFAVALTLGGGPRATTIELAIYQAFRFDFDLGRAALLGLMQIALAGGAALLALRMSRLTGLGGGLDRIPARWDGRETWRKVADGGVIVLAALFLLVPLAMVILRGAQGIPSMPLAVWHAALTSVWISLLSTAVMLMLAVPMVIAAAGRRSLIEGVGLLGIAASPLVIGTGLFVIINPVMNPATLALPVTACVNALMALPFALRVMAPAASDIVRDYGRLSQSLDLTGFAWLKTVFLPRIRQPLGFAAGLTAALSMGDLGVIALFADPDTATLPLQMYRLMGAYRMDGAAGAALILLILSLGMFWIFERGGRANADT